MVSQSLLPGFKPPALSGNSRRRERSKLSKSGGESNNVILWPEFKISPPDPVLGKLIVFCEVGKILISDLDTMLPFVRLKMERMNTQHLWSIV